MAELVLKDVRKSFGAVEVIKGVSLDIRSGEFMVFVGPSGCGKSTLLRLIAGLEDITSGTLSFDGQVVNSLSPSKQKFYSLPTTTDTPRVVRTFKFDRLNGQWSINGQFMDCNTFRFTVQQNSSEHWLLTNLTGDWTHPVHIHLEEHQILSQSNAIDAVDVSRKDVHRLQHNQQVQLFFRFRDFQGRYPFHCHNVVHEDHAMMLRWDIDQTGDTNTLP